MNLTKIKEVYDAVEVGHIVSFQWNGDARYHIKIVEKTESGLRGYYSMWWKSENRMKLASHKIGYFPSGNCTDIKILKKKHL